MAKSRERIKARELRSNGESIKEIAKKLSVSVGSVSLWCRDIELTDEQIAKLERRARDPNYGKRLEYTRKLKRRRVEKTRLLRQQGIEEIGKLSEREIFLIGVALYWAEGFKKEKMAGFSNSDPRMIKIFMSWLTKCCNVKAEEISVRVTLNMSHKHRLDEIQSYWSEILGIPITKFNKPYYQKTVWKKVYANPENYFGVIRIRVRKSTDLLREIHGWIEGLRLQEY